MKNEGKQKGKAKRVKRIRNMVSMLLVSILLLSGATYAWFTLSRSSSVTGLSLTAGTAGGLLIGKDTDSYESSLTIDMTSDTDSLMPATTKKTFGPTLTIYKPEYMNEDVSSFTPLDKETVEEDGNTVRYYYQKDFYLKALGSGDDQNVYLEPAKKSGDVFSTGTFFCGSDNKLIDAVSALRVSFTINYGDVTKTVIFEPDSDSRVAEPALRANVTAGDIDDYGAPANVSENLSPLNPTLTGGALFQIPKETDVHVTMNMWLEGTDNDCANPIAAQNLIGQIVFTTVNE